MHGVRFARSVRFLGRVYLGAAARLALLAALAALAAVACGDGDSPPGGVPGPDDRLSLTFMAGFRAQANLPFVAVYVAQQEGFFDEVGLDVTIQHSAGQGEHLRLLLAGEVDVTTQPASELLQNRASADAPLVAVALWGQTGQLGYAVLADSGITSPAGFKGKIVGFKGAIQAEFLAMLQAHGLTPDDVNLVSVGFNPAVLTEGTVDVYPVFTSNEPDTLRRQLSADIRVFTAAEDGVPTLGLTSVVTEDFLADAARREALRRFLLATLRAFQFARDHPDQAIEDTRAFIPEDTDLQHERFILDTELAQGVSALTGEHGLGWFTEEQFQALHDVLIEYGGLEKPVAVREAIDRTLLESIYRDGVLQWPGG